MTSATGRSAALERLRESIGDCARCALGATRMNLVFGFGDPDARVMLVGEAPGRNEDLKGEPFVGAAGKLLDELLAEAHLARDEIYIANVMKCRPPRNRNPLRPEVEACTPFLREQIRIIDPKLLVPMGNFATRVVLVTEESITSLRGHLRCVGNTAVLPIFHPAAAIYDRSKREALFSDFRRMRELLDSGSRCSPDVESTR